MNTARKRAVRKLSFSYQYTLLNPSPAGKVLFFYFSCMFIVLYTTINIHFMYVSKYRRLKGVVPNAIQNGDYLKRAFNDSYVLHINFQPNLNGRNAHKWYDTVVKVF